MKGDNFFRIDKATKSRIHRIRENRDWYAMSNAIILQLLDYIEAQGPEFGQDGLAKKLGVSPAQVSKWLKPESNFTLRTISKLNKAVGYKLQIYIDQTDQSKASELHGNDNYMERKSGVFSVSITELQYDALIGQLRDNSPMIITNCPMNPPFDTMAVDLYEEATY